MGAGLRFRLAGQDVLDRHICGLAHSMAETYVQVGPFVLDGLAAGERAVQLVPNRVAHLEALRALGVDVAGRLESGQLEVFEWSESYLSGGIFTPAAALRFVRQSLDEGRRLGYPRTRWVGMAEWAAAGSPWAVQLLEFEQQLDRLFRTRRDLMWCAYDLSRHSAAAIAALLQAHTLSFLDGVLSLNGPQRQATARERILAAADDHFYTIGIRATGVDLLIEAAAVAKATFYRHFRSKDELVVAWLRDARPRWFTGVRQTIEAARIPPDKRVVRLFEEAATWLEDSGFRGCAFQNAAAELTDSSHPAWPVISAYFDEIEAWLRETCGEAGLRNAAGLAEQLGALLSGGVALGVARRSTAPLLAAHDAAAQLVSSADRT